MSPWFYTITDAFVKNNDNFPLNEFIWRQLYITFPKTAHIMLHNWEFSTTNHYETSICSGYSYWLMYWSALINRPADDSLKFTPWIFGHINSHKKIVSHFILKNLHNLVTTCAKRRQVEQKMEILMNNRQTSENAPPLHKPCRATGNTIAHDQTTKNLCNHWQKSVVIDLAEQYPMFIVYSEGRILANSNPYFIDYI